MTRNDITRNPFPKNIVSNWMKISDEDLIYTNPVTINVMLKAICNSREMEIVISRYKDGMTLRQVAEKFGITPERVRQIELKLIEKARHPHFLKVVITNKEIREKYRK